MIFTRENVLRIARGAKSETRRLREPRVTVGNTYRLRTSFYSKEDWGRIKVLDKYRERLGAVDERSFRSEGCRCRQAFFEMFDSINGHVHRNRKVWVVRFRYIGYM